MTKLAKLSLTPTSHTQKIARNSTSVWTELSPVNWDVRLERSSTMKPNVVTHPKAFPDGKTC
jgi:hypothetical protein